jgi:hypothetical protein
MIWPGPLPRSCSRTVRSGSLPEVQFASLVLMHFAACSSFPCYYPHEILVCQSSCYEADEGDSMHAYRCDAVKHDSFTSVQANKATVGRRKYILSEWRNRVRSEEGRDGFTARHADSSQHMYTGSANREQSGSSSLALQIRHGQHNTISPKISPMNPCVQHKLGPTTNVALS